MVYKIQHQSKVLLVEGQDGRDALEQSGLTFNQIFVAKIMNSSGEWVSAIAVKINPDDLD